MNLKFTNGKNKLRILLLTVIFEVVSFGLIYAQQNNSSQILNPDGTINSSLKDGSYSLTGYQMIIGKNGIPVFKKNNTENHSKPNDIHWDSHFYQPELGVSLGSQGFVYAIAKSNNKLFIGGDFSYAGNIVTNNVAFFDLTTGKWYALDTTSPDMGVSGRIMSIAINGSDVYLGGTFKSAGGNSANNLIDWNMSTGKWSPLGVDSTNGTDGIIFKMIFVGNDLYVGGNFKKAGGITVNNIARWDGSAWHSLGDGVDNIVKTLATNGGVLYAGGNFKNAGGTASNFVAKWDGSTWQPLGNGDELNSTVNSLIAVSNRLYIGGYFTSTAGNPGSYITEWTGSKYKALAGGVDKYVYDMSLHGSKLYAGGYFTRAGLVTVSHFAVWDTSTGVWSSPGNLMNDFVWSVLSDSNNIYCTGFRFVFGNESSVGIVKWNGNKWSTLDNTMSNSITGYYVLSLAAKGDSVYIGGYFNHAGDVNANNIVLYNKAANKWSLLGSGQNNGVDGTVTSILINNDKVYVGGNFKKAGGSAAKNIAEWDGNSWSALGKGTNSTVDALGMFASTLYAGGRFDTAGTIQANYVAGWNIIDKKWNSLGTGVNSNVTGIAAGNSVIYVCGSFSSAGGNSANNVASWNGSSWSALGAGINKTCNCIATKGDTLFAGGSFDKAGNDSAKAIAMWDGNSWHNLGGGINGNVMSLSINHQMLYVSGLFSSAGITNANNIAVYNISNGIWSSLGSGLNGLAFVVAASGNDVWTGGYFTLAGNKPSFLFGHYSQTITSVKTESKIFNTFELNQNYPNPFNPSTNITFSIPHQSHVIIKVYDILGRKVATLVNNELSSGKHKIVWNADKFSSGVYFYQLNVKNENKIITKKMLLLK